MSYLNEEFKRTEPPPQLVFPFTLPNQTMVSNANVAILCLYVVNFTIVKEHQQGVNKTVNSLVG